MANQDSEFSYSFASHASRSKVGYCVEAMEDGFRVVFPRSARAISTMAACLGFLAVVWLFFTCIESIAGHALHRGPHAGIPTYHLVILGLVTVGIVALAWKMYLTYRVIELIRGELRLTRKTFFRKVLHRFPVNETTDIQLDAGFQRRMEEKLKKLSPSMQVDGIGSGMLNRKKALVQVLLREDKPMDLCSGEVGWMAPLAQVLSTQLARAKEGQIPVGDDLGRRRAALPVDFPSLELPEPSGNGGATLERREDGLRVTLPAPGWRGNTTIRVLGKAAWLGVGLLLFFTAVGVVVACFLWGQIAKVNPLVLVGPALMVILLWFTVNWMFLNWLRKASEGAVVDVNGDGMLLVDHGLFHRRPWWIDRDGVLDLDVRATGEAVRRTARRTNASSKRKRQQATKGAPIPMTIRVYALHVLDSDGTDDWLFAGREKDDLDWLAAVLRKALGFPDEEGKEKSTSDSASTAPGQERRRRPGSR